MMRRFLILTLLLCLCSWAKAVDIVMPSNGSNTVALSVGVTYRVLDPGGATQNYPNNCSSHLILTAPAGYNISFDGQVNLSTSTSSSGWGGGSSTGGDSLAFYNSTTANSSSYLCGYSSSSTCLLTVNGTTAHLVFVSNSSGVSSGYAITVRLVQSPSNYSSSGCVDFLDFTSTGFSAYYGTFTNPSRSTGVAPGRHEIVYFDTLDPNTNNQLHRIPPGENYSIRLGNDLPGGEAERITYSYTVDTTVAPLLILKYAAVLQSPNHSADRNPKFSFRLLDQNGQDINQTCYSATFIADASLGWNTCTPSGSSTSVCWKDWTTVGVDLAGVHGQTITIELTSYDCNPQQTGHYGYAYFTISCAEKIIRTSACGSFTRDTLTAPAGFTYDWHRTSSPTVSLGTGQQYVVTAPGTYGCYLNFVGDPTHTCQFELSAIVSSVYTFARFTSDYDSTDVGTRQVCFQNQSGISSTINVNDIDPSRSYTSWWDFGDGSTSTQQNPCHTFQPGEYDVTLVINEVGRSCTDTATMHISISTIQIVQLVDSICDGSQYEFFDTVLTTAGVYSHEEASTRTILTLSLLPIFSVSDHVDVVENDLPLLWEGNTFFSDTDTTIVLRSANGCDSTVHLTVKVYFNSYDTVDTVICSSMLPWEWNGVTFTQAGSRTATLVGAHGEDSLVTMNVEVLDSYVENYAFRSCESEQFEFEGHTYSQTGIYSIRYTAINGCDSVLRLDLVIEEPPEIKISAEPAYATYENLNIFLKHLGSGAAQWEWTLLGETISTSQSAAFQFSLDYDSVEVCLVAASASGCADTGCIVIPFYKGSVWVPNAFTPDLSENNTFSIKWHQISQGHVWIYDRFGQLLAEFDALDGSWDGTYQGIRCPQGAYVWQLRYSTLDHPNRIQVEKGTVLLIR